MAYTRAYPTWADSPATTTPINAASAQHIEDGIVGLSDGTLAHDKVSVTNGTTSANGIAFGSDVTLYRSAANVLTSDDTIQAVIDLYARVGAATQVLLGSVGGNAGIALGSAADTTLSRSAAGVISMNGSIVQSNVLPATTLPGSPVNGQEAILTDSTTVPTYNWRFIFSSAAAAWLYAGGASAIAEVATAQALTTATYSDLTTVGPSFTVPRAGTYLVEIGSLMSKTVGAANQSWMSFAVGATTATDADSITQHSSGTQTQDFSLSRTVKKSGVAASAAIVAKYRSDGTNSATWANRYLRVTPLLVT